MKFKLFAALTLVLVQAMQVAAAQPATPELRYEPPANFYRSASSPPDDYSATDVNAGLQVYPFRPFTGDIEQTFRRTLLRDWVDPRFREANVMAPPDFRLGAVAGARLVLSARFTESVGGVARQRQRLLVVAGDAAAIIDASAATLQAWQQILPQLNDMSASTRVEAGRAAPGLSATTTVPTAPLGGATAGIAGLYAGTRKSYIPDLMRGVSYGSYVPTPHYYLFAADGRVYRAFNGITAPYGLERFDFEAARRSDPENSGRYAVQGGLLRIRMGQGASAEAIDTALPQGGRLTIQAVPYERQ
jgi:hypothetical protein